MFTRQASRQKELPMAFTQSTYLKIKYAAFMSDSDESSADTG